MDESVRVFFIEQFARSLLCRSPYIGKDLEMFATEHPLIMAQVTKRMGDLSPYHDDKHTTAPASPFNSGLHIAPFEMETMGHARRDKLLYHWEQAMDGGFFERLFSEPQRSTSTSKACGNNELDPAIQHTNEVQGSRATVHLSPRMVRRPLQPMTSSMSPTGAPLT